MGEIEQLVRRAKKRDPDAFTELMQLHEKDMYRTASAILPQDADIADAIQETILTVWEKIDTLQKNRYFKTWMIRILINKCKDILRSGRRMICVEELPEQEDEQPALEPQAQPGGQDEGQHGVGDADTGVYHV